MSSLPLSPVVICYATLLVKRLTTSPTLILRPRPFCALKKKLLVYIEYQQRRQLSWQLFPNINFVNSQQLS